MILKNSSGKVFLVKPTLHADVITFQNNFSSAGGVLDDNQLYGLNDFVKGLEITGIKSKVQHFFPLLGTTSATQAVPLYGNTITFSSTIPSCHTPKGFISGNLAYYGDTGISNLQQGNTAPWAGMHCYVSESRREDVNQVLFFGIIRATFGFGVGVYNNGLIYIDYYADASHTVSNTSSFKGNYLFTRIDNNTVVTKDLRSGKATRTRAISLPIQDDTYASTLRIGSPGIFSVSYCTIGSASYTLNLTSSELDEYDNLITTLMKKIGRA